MTNESRTTSPDQLTKEQILAKSEKLLAATRELIHGVYEMTRLLQVVAKEDVRRKRRCGAMTSLNRPCRAKLELGEVRCARHLHQGRAAASNEHVDRAIWLIPEAQDDEEVVRANGLANSVAEGPKTLPACGARIEGGVRCTRSIVPGKFRCEVHDEGLRKRRKARRKAVGVQAGEVPHGTP